MSSACDLSFIVITNNLDYEHTAKRVVDSVERSVGHYSHEIIVCSPHELTGIDSRIKPVLDKGNGNGNTVQAYNMSYKMSLGDYIFILNDDHEIDGAALKSIEMLNGPLFESRKYKVTSIGAGHGCNKWVSTCVPSLAFPPPFPLTEELQDRRFVEKDRYLIMGYPVFERATVERYLQGFLLHPDFKHHYADNWLPFWLGESGEEPLICDGTPLYPFGTPHSNCTNDEEDYNTFTRLVHRMLKEGYKEYV